MSDLLYKLLPMLLSLTLSLSIYLKIDEKYAVTNKISSKLRIQQQWKAFFCVNCIMISILIIGVFGIYVIDIPAIIYSILSGILAGMGIGMANKMSIKKSK